MAKTSSQPRDDSKPKPDAPTNPSATDSAPETPQVIPSRVFNDFAAI